MTMHPPLFIFTSVSHSCCCYCSSLTVIMTIECLYSHFVLSLGFSTSVPLAAPFLVSIPLGGMGGKWLDAKQGAGGMVRGRMVAPQHLCSPAFAPPLALLL